MEVTVLILSTAHITEAEFDFLTECPNKYFLVWTEKQPAEGYGLWLYTGLPDDDDFLASFRKILPAIADIFQFAWDRGVMYVRLTPDADTTNDLPTYDW